MQLTTNVSVCKIKGGKQLNFLLLFPIKNSPENGFYIKYLTYILSTTSKKFPLKKDFEIEKLRKVLFNNFIELEQKNSIYSRIPSHVKKPNIRIVANRPLATECHFFIPIVT